MTNFLKFFLVLNFFNYQFGVFGQFSFFVKLTRNSTTAFYEQLFSFLGQVWSWSSLKCWIWNFCLFIRPQDKWLSLGIMTNLLCGLKGFSNSYCYQLVLTSTVRGMRLIMSRSYYEWNNRKFHAKELLQLVRGPKF